MAEHTEIQDPTKFYKKVRPELHPAAQELIDAYESVPGGKTYPCLPEGIAAVLERLALSVDRANQEEADIASFMLKRWATLLRGEQP